MTYGTAYETGALTVSSRTTAQGIVLEAVGDVELTTAATLEQPLTEGVQATIDAAKPASLSVDLRRVDFIDSAGLALLVAARRRLASLSLRSLQVLLTPGSQPDRVLRLGRFDTIVTLTYDERDC